MQQRCVDYALFALLEVPRHLAGAHSVFIPFGKHFLSTAWRQGEDPPGISILNTICFVYWWRWIPFDVSFDFFRKEHVHEWVRVWFSLKESIGIIRYCVLVANRFWMLKNSCRI
ncbi:hypothetical protein CEXT_542451 [Caerostris extrusa]|uniref:Uncharacterized protein n=1 Tax=Caerostris extrusa TaxID=172846 RepID=A0AAV4NM67_CAEEX|nr:hypothetical protein CEXT_542451 [Caerostris extrusa]